MYKWLTDFFSSLELTVSELANTTWSATAKFAQGLFCSAYGSIPITAAIGIIALWIAIKNYWRKSGINITGGYAVSSDYTSTQKYISELILENQKDRAVTIYAIYLKIGFNYYVELEDLGDSPIILKSYESLKRSYRKPYLYGASSTVVSINEALIEKRFKKSIVLSTGSGKYIVPSPIKRWNPIIDHFSNSSIITIFPQTLPYKEVMIGDNIKYIANISHGDKEINFPITKYESSVTSIFGVRFTQEDLRDKDSLISAIATRKANGEIPIDAFIDVKDASEIIGSSLDFYENKNAISLPHVNYLTYTIYGRIIAKIKTIRIKIENRRR